KSVTVRSVAANQTTNVARSPCGTSAMAEASASDDTEAVAASSVAAKPLVRAPIQSRSHRPFSTRCTSKAANSATSVPGRTGRWRSAMSQVGVMRGSITTTLVPRLSLAAARRWYSTGWHQAALLPTADLRVQQAPGFPERLGQRGALRAEAAAIGGMLLVSGDRSVRGDGQPATDPAIGAGRADRGDAGHAASHRGSSAVSIAGSK